MNAVATKLIALANVALFNNNSDKVMFYVNKTDKVKATMSGFDNDKGYDIKALAGEKDGKPYIRISFAIGEGENREYANGVLFPTKDKKSEKSPDYYGVIGEVNAPVARLAAWEHTGEKAGKFLSLSISAPNAAEPEAAPEATA